MRAFSAWAVKFQYAWLTLLVSLIWLAACQSAAQSNSTPTVQEDAPAALETPSAAKATHTPPPLTPTASLQSGETVTATVAATQTGSTVDNGVAASIISFVASDQTLQEVELPPVDPLDVKGNIRLTGSQTALPMIEILYQNFVQDGYPGEVQISSVGTERGLRLLCEGGDIDIVTASRRMTPQLVDMCAAQGRPPLEFPVAIDAVTVVVSANNSFAQEVSKAELAALFTAEYWSDVNPAWPNQPIQRYIPPLDSGTFGFFVDTVLDGNTAALLNATNFHQNIDFLNVAEDVADDPYGVGFMGYVYYAPYQRNHQLKALAIDDMSITDQTVKSGVYPLTRPLYLYSSLTVLAGKPQVTEFLNFFLTHVTTLLPQHDYFVLAPEVLNRSKGRLQEVILGEITITTNPLASAITEAMRAPFAETGYQGDIHIDLTRSNEDFRRLCQDWDADVVVSARKVRLEEIISCTVSNRIPVEFPIGSDGLTIVVNVDNKFVRNVTLAELAALFQVETWSDVRPEWPNTPIERFIPDPGLGAFSAFTQKVLNDDSAAILRAPRTITTRDYSIIARGVANTANGIGFLPDRVYRQNSNSLAGVQIDGVESSGDTLADGRYPLSMALFLYSTENVLQQKPQAAAYVNFFLTHLNQQNEQLGYVPASPRTLEASRAKLLETILAPD